MTCQRSDAATQQALLAVAEEQSCALVTNQQSAVPASEPEAAGDVAAAVGVTAAGTVDTAAAAVHAAGDVGTAAARNCACQEEGGGCSVGMHVCP